MHLFFHDEGKHNFDEDEDEDQNDTESMNNLPQNTNKLCYE